MNASISKPRSQSATQAVLAWYDANGRVLPWRYGRGLTPDPYRVWLAEVMLQQTTVATVKPYFQHFTTKWPTVHNLASADRGAVMAAWSGLGYYARARNLHRCAKAVVADYGGHFPESEAELLKLPGIGAYTAASVAAIAFGQRTVVVDANIERVLARWQAIGTPLPQAKPMIRSVMGELTPEVRPGDFAQALMDIGAMICTPPRKNALPKCGECPLGKSCRGRQEGVHLFPVKPAKTPRPDRFGTALVVEDRGGNILLEKRGDSGMLGGMLVFPGSCWADGSPQKTDYPLAENPAALALLDRGEARRLNATVTHIFTHFRVILSVVHIRVDRVDLAEGRGWLLVPKGDLSAAALPTVMRKVARLVGLV